MTERFWVGLDVGESQTNICIIDEMNRAVLEQSIPSNLEAIEAAFDGRSTDQVADVVLETGVDRRLARQLRERAFPVTVLNGVKTRQFLSIRQNKTDANDARGLAEIARAGHHAMTPVHLKSQEFQNLRAHLVMRNQLMEQKIDLQNAMRALLFEQGVSRKLPHGRRFRKDFEQMLAPLPPDHANQVRDQILALLPVLETIRAYLVAANKRLQKWAEEDPVMSRFLRIPGVGVVCAVSFYTAIEDPWRFSRTSDVGAYFGIVPRVKQSGSILHKSRITRAGNRLTRSHLFMSANVLLNFGKCDSSLRDWGLALAARSGRAKAKVAVARKLAVVMLSMWKSGCDFNPYPPVHSLPAGSGAGLDADHIIGA